MPQNVLWVKDSQYILHVIFISNDNLCYITFLYRNSSSHLINYVFIL